jgi:hypothetical protein
MTAKQFLLVESTYCRERAASCADRYIVRRLAEQFERTAKALDSAARTKFATMPGEPRV